jgi:hypothetical protein
MAALPIDLKPALKAPTVAPELREDPRIRLAQLARLHDEAAKTSVLANLLGRAPQAMGALTACALAAVALSYGAVPLQQAVVWFALVGAGAVAVWRAYARAIDAPFELFTLRAFSADLTAILFYTGFAWGAGAFLALAPQGNVVAAALFVGVPAALVAGLLRSQMPALVFLVPAAGLTVMATLLRPVGGLGATLLTAIACAAVVGLTYWMEKLSAPLAAPSLAMPAVR